MEDATADLPSGQSLGNHGETPGLEGLAKAAITDASAMTADA